MTHNMLSVLSGAKLTNYIDGRRVSRDAFNAMNGTALRKECFSTVNKDGKLYHRHVIRTA